ncbi:MAG: hypothetical protein ACPH5S_07255, partial [Candidatus Poseidoniaceae archaeon]
AVNLQNNRMQLALFHFIQMKRRENFFIVAFGQNSVTECSRFPTISHWAFLDLTATPVGAIEAFLAVLSHRSLNEGGN